MQATWLEFVNEDGLKVRVTIRGHWRNVNRDAELAIRGALAAAGLSLTDYEEEEEA